MRHADAPVGERVEVMGYLAELRLRLGDAAAARVLRDVAADEVRAHLPG